MKILLVRPGYTGWTGRLSLVQTEPLELEILAAVAASAGQHSQIYDGVLEKKPFRQVLNSYQPDLVAITGYITQQSRVLLMAATVKRLLPSARVVVGGVHAQLNFRDFFHPAVDFIVYSGGVRPFRQLITTADLSLGIAGTCRRQPDNSWQVQPAAPFDPDDAPGADRSYFMAHQTRFNYLGISPCALIKTSSGCPHGCNFCYCRLLDGGQYRCRDLERVVDEIAAIPSQWVWIVDDTFYLDRGRIGNFIRLIREKGIRKRFIVYYRADFIAANEESIQQLKSVGLAMVIVGLEACDNRQLDGYGKGTTAAVNEACLAVLRRNEIACTALFMVDLAATREDFRRLGRYVRQHRLTMATASILTPLPGTAQYASYRHRLTTADRRRWDFLHLVAEPAAMGRLEFYSRFWAFYLRLALRQPSGQDFRIPIRQLPGRLYRSWLPWRPSH